MDALLQGVEVEPVVGGDHDLAVDDGALRERRLERLDQLREVALERERVAARDVDVVAVAKDDRPKPVPLRLVEPLALAWDVRRGARQHRLERRIEGQRHERSVADRALLRLGGEDVRPACLAHPKAEQVVHVDDVADLADRGLEAGDVGQLVDLAAERDHAAAGADLEPGREVAEAERESDADAVGEGLVPAGRLVPPRADVDGGSDEGRDAECGATGGCAAARPGAGMKEEGCQCDDCGAGGGCRELEDPGHEGTSDVMCRSCTYKRAASRVVTRVARLVPGYCRHPMKRPPDETRTGVVEIVKVFLGLGCVAFGGPVAHVALMRRSVVERRRWVDQQEFSELFAACQLIPGPTSTELAVLLGYRRAGWRGLAAAAACFIAPAAVLMTAIAAVYQRYGESPLAREVLGGVTPVVVGIVAWAVLDLARRSVRTIEVLAVGVAVAAVASFINQPIALLAGGGAVVAVVRLLRRGGGLRAVLPWTGAQLTVTAAGAATPSLAVIFLTFLKLGAVAFGSGYVLLVLLRSEFVLSLHWLTERQVVDAIAVSQATPCTVFTAATFIGYLLAGLAGAVLATIAIFLPGVALVPLLHKVFEVVRRHLVLTDALAGVNVAALGLIAATAIVLGRDTFTSGETGRHRGGDTAGAAALAADDPGAGRRGRRDRRPLALTYAGGGGK